MLDKKQIQVLNEVMYEMAIKGTKNIWDLTASELAIIIEAEKLGWILRTSHTQIEWTQLGVDETTVMEDEQQTDPTQQAEDKIEIVYQSPIRDLEKEINTRNANIKHEVTTIEELTEKLSNANPKHTGYIKQLKQRRLVLLKKKAAVLVDAPTTQQYDFICTAPEGEWRELLQIVLEGADPVIWERKRASYDPDWQAKASKKAQKRKKARKAYAINGGSVYPSKKHNNTARLICYH